MHTAEAAAVCQTHSSSVESVSRAASFMRVLQGKKKPVVMHAMCFRFCLSQRNPNIPQVLG